MGANYNLFEELLLRTDWSGDDRSRHRVLDLLNAVSISFIQFKNELEPPSSAVVALSANAGNDLASSLSCALNCVTDNHLLLERICVFLNTKRNAKQLCSDKYLVPGMGHPSIKGEDPRVKYLFNEFKDLAGEKVNFYLELEKLLKVKINIGGAMCSLMLDAGIKQEYILYFPLVGRLFGWCETFNKTKQKFNKVVPSNKIINEDN
ncbi:MAG: citrate/2-methylcitrate synthase [Paracoccaceae bacterium]